MCRKAECFIPWVNKFRPSAVVRDAQSGKTIAEITNPATRCCSCKSNIVQVSSDEVEYSVMSTKCCTGVCLPIKPCNHIEFKLEG